MTSSPFIKGDGEGFYYNKLIAKATGTTVMTG
jgi:hypothetical protein